MICSRKTTESVVIFTTLPLKTGSFSRRKYVFFCGFSTTAMIALGDLTMPRSTISPITRHFLPLTQGAPPVLSGLRMMLTKGSRALAAGFLISGATADGFASAVALATFAGFAAVVAAGCDFAAALGVNGACFAGAFAGV